MNILNKGVHLDIYLVMSSIIGILYDIVVRNQFRIHTFFLASLFSRCWQPTHSINVDSFREDSLMCLAIMLITLIKVSVGRVAKSVNWIKMPSGAPKSSFLRDFVELIFFYDTMFVCRLAVFSEPHKA